MSEVERLRLFVAARVPAEHLEEVEDALGGFKQGLQGARWVDLPNQHVTLKFLGSTFSDRLKAVAEVCKLVAGTHVASQASLTDLGAFPSLKRARVLWVGLNDPGELLRGLADDLADSFEPLGYAAEKRPYTPHLTLARFTSPARIEGLLPVLPRLNPFPIDRIELMRSRLARGGARYEVLQSFPLVGRK
ncbi:MAG: RNA 2',3'-cyclic phosphodiesterase [Actinomycetota bacterium]